MLGKGERGASCLNAWDEQIGLSVAPSPLQSLSDSYKSLLVLSQSTHVYSVNSLALMDCSPLIKASMSVLPGSFPQERREGSAEAGGTLASGIDFSVESVHSKYRGAFIGFFTTPLSLTGSKVGTRHRADGPTDTHRSLSAIVRAGAFFLSCALKRAP